mgnify:FL=1
MNYLCVCQYGHSRSVALARVLHHNGVSAVAVGWQTSPEGLIVLSKWADRILLLDNSFIDKIPNEQRDKCFGMHVGPDRWSNPYNTELLNILAKMTQEFLKIGDGTI